MEEPSSIAAATVGSSKIRSQDGIPASRARSNREGSLDPAWKRIPVVLGVAEPPRFFGLEPTETTGATAGP
jgi:hypothetical protein